MAVLTHLLFLCRNPPFEIYSMHKGYSYMVPWLSDVLENSRD